MAHHPGHRGHRALPGHGARRPGGGDRAGAHASLSAASGRPAGREALLAWVPRLRGSGWPEPPESFSQGVPFMQSFAELGVSSAVARALAARGITEPFAVQKLVVPDVLRGRDVLAKSPTGSGKTLAFGVPVVDRTEGNTPRRPAALGLARTRGLATPIVAELRGVAHPRPRRGTAGYGGGGRER